MGVRMALGAEKTDVIKLVLRQGLSLTLAGIALRLAVSLALNKVLEKMMFEIGTTDTVTFFGATVIFLVVAMAACVIPAIRAMRVHP
jgi:putative ABC transport system permease protein